MAELEIHHEHGHEEDEFGKTVGIMTAVLAVLLAIVTIMSHRAHTEGVLLKTDANDKWSYYQANRIKYHNLELGTDLINALPKDRSEEASKILTRYAKEKGKYAKQAEKIQEDAKALEEETAALERRALRYDFGEGFLEIGLILSSLYFISKSKMFPVVGLVAAVGGIGLAVSGYLL